MNYRIFFIIIMIALTMMVMVVSVEGVPTTGSVTNVTAYQVDFSATGSGSIGWFQWGSFLTGPFYWATPNQTYSGSFSDFQYGPPMLTGSTYYVQACDDTGCGNVVSWTTPASSLPNRTSYGAGLIQLMHNGFDMNTLLAVMVSPYTLTMPGGAPVVWGLLFFFIFAGYWLRPKDIFMPCILAMMAGGAIWLGNGSLGVPPAFASIGQGLMYAAIAGIAMSWFSK